MPPPSPAITPANSTPKRGTRMVRVACAPKAAATAIAATSSEAGSSCRDVGEVLVTWHLTRSWSGFWSGRDNREAGSQVGSGRVRGVSDHQHPPARLDVVLQGDRHPGSGRDDPAEPGHRDDRQQHVGDLVL